MYRESKDLAKLWYFTNIAFPQAGQRFPETNLLPFGGPGRGQVAIIDPNISFQFHPQPPRHDWSLAAPDAIFPKGRAFCG